MGKNVGLTEIDKQAIADLYEQGINGKDIGSMFGVSKVRVSQIAREFGLKRHEKELKYSEEDVKLMYNMYILGSNVEEIADKYGFNRASVYNLFKKYNFILDEDRYRIYDVDDEYFDSIDTSNKAYILGFLWADGHNNTHKGIIEMKLQERDKHILEDISVEMKNQRPLYFSEDQRPNRQDLYKICITSRKISNALLKYGMCSNKTYILRWPDALCDSLTSHFLRGFTDGDGHVDEHELSWSGTYMMMQKIQEILYSNFNIESKMYNTKTDIIKNLRVCKKTDIITILHWIYKDADLKLNRKYIRYQEIIN